MANLLTSPSLIGEIVAGDNEVGAAYRAITVGVGGQQLTFEIPSAVFDAFTVPGENVELVASAQGKRTITFSALQAAELFDFVFKTGQANAALIAQRVAASGATGDPTGAAPVTAANFALALQAAFDTKYGGANVWPALAGMGFNVTGAAAQLQKRGVDLAPAVVAQNAKYGPCATLLFTSARPPTNLDTSTITVNGIDAVVTWAGTENTSQLIMQKIANALTGVGGIAAIVTVTPYFASDPGCVGIYGKTDADRYTVAVANSGASHVALDPACPGTLRAFPAAYSF